ncbi:3-oxoacyl-FabG [Phialemonium atrogriseum]|uniref:3-oxoacyl-FabG n=1 Tax=Phialemonium atrogriseum TaxID=1093897 RepID=A0AAJ0FD06_9PEZI|nr:3-oxoacyl-FabG [Phialemonium atrogriseum]KAK1762687.1 3-oxoacyl-FabG [Phialemonium atrogriseum]
MSLAGKIVIITGASSGVGRATAIKAASEGAVLALGDMNLSGLGETVGQCRAASSTSTTTETTPSHLQFMLDVGSTDDWDSFVKAVMDAFGKIDCVFNCAGINPTAISTEKISDAVWDKMVNTNLKGVFNATRACLPYMKSGSAFVNVSSVAGLHPVPELALYCATKHAVIGFSKSVALEVGPRGIRVNVVAPGMVDTPTNSAVRAGREAVDRAAESVGLRRFGTAEEVAEVVVFLLEERSRYMNGSVVEVHGGIGVQ